MCGIAFPGVEYVVNLNFPLMFIHRVNRTTHGGKKGTACYFFTPEYKAYYGELINVLKQANMNVPGGLPEFSTTFKNTDDETSKATKALFFFASHIPLIINPSHIRRFFFSYNKLLFFI